MENKPTHFIEAYVAWFGGGVMYSNKTPIHLKSIAMGISAGVGLHTVGIKYICEAKSYWEVFQMEKYGRILKEENPDDEFPTEDNRMPEFFEREILEKE